MYISPGLFHLQHQSFFSNVIIKSHLVEHILPLSFYKEQQMAPVDLRVQTRCSVVWMTLLKSKEIS